MMTTTPTPEEAQRSLREISDRKRQGAEAAASSRWWFVGCGVATVAYGVLVDRVPSFSDTWGNAIVWVLLLLVIARSSRWGASLFGLRLRPRRPGGPRRRLGLGVLGAVVSLAVVLVVLWLDVAHLSLWIGVGGGLLIAVAGPWWQARALRRSARL
jgi:hypothetical protein